MADYSLLRLYLADTTEPQVFTNDQLDVFLEATQGDVDAAAAKGWGVKAATVADWYDVNLDGSSLSRSDVFKHCQAMAQFYSGTGSGGPLARNIELEGPSKPQTDTESEFA